MTELVLTPRAQKMVLDTINWYDEKREGQGTSFYRELLELFRTISLMPKAFRKEYKNIHMASLTNYPYMVFYILSSKRIMVLAILHTSKNPADWPTSPD